MQYISIKDKLRLTAALCVQSDMKPTDTVEDAIQRFVVQLRRYRSQSHHKEQAPVILDTVHAAQRLLDELPAFTDLKAGSALHQLRQKLQVVTCRPQSQEQPVLVQYDADPPLISSGHSQASLQAILSIGEYLHSCSRSTNDDLTEGEGMGLDIKSFIHLSSTFVASAVPLLATRLHNSRYSCSSIPATVHVITTLVDGVLRTVSLPGFVTDESLPVDIAWTRPLADLLSIRLPRDAQETLLQSLVSVVSYHCDALAGADAEQDDQNFSPIADLYTVVLLHLLRQFKDQRRDFTSFRSGTVQMAVLHCLRCLRRVAGSSDRSVLLLYFEKELANCSRYLSWWSVVEQGNA